MPQAGTTTDKWRFFLVLNGVIGDIREDVLAGCCLADRFSGFRNDPVRYRPLMLPAIVEKAGFGIAACILYIVGRLNIPFFAAGIIDLVFGLLFVVAYSLTPSEYRPAVPQ